MINQPLQIAHSCMAEALKDFMAGIDYLATAQPSPATTNVIAHTRAVLHTLMDTERDLLLTAEALPYETN